MLEIKNYSKSYDGGKKAADNVTLTVESGGWVGVSGGTVTDITMYGASPDGGSRAGTMFV